MEMSFENKVVIITGSGSGIGAATAVLFAKVKANVVIVDINEAEALTVRDQCIQHTERVLVINADVSKVEDGRSIIDKTIEQFGRIDILVNNAGIVREEKIIIDGTMMNVYDQVLNTNLRSVVTLTNFAAPHLIKTKGCIVNTSSVAAISPKTGALYPSYCISKAGVSTFTELSAAELGVHGVRVNAICPGLVNTSLLVNGNIKDKWETYVHMNVLHVVIDPEEIGELILFLASDKAKSITGSSYVIDAGMLVK